MWEPNILTILGKQEVDGHWTPYMGSVALHWCTHVNTLSGRQAVDGHWTEYNVVSSWTLVYTC